jgi:hypothetical protein
VKLTLVPGRTLRRRVVDVRGAGVANLEIVTGDSNEERSQVDGSFELAGLHGGSVSICTGIRDGRFAVGSFGPDDQDAMLTLRPGGRVVRQVTRPDGAPAARAWAPVVEVACGSAARSGPAAPTARGAWSAWCRPGPSS